MKTTYALEGKTKSGNWEGISFADHETLEQAQEHTRMQRARKSLNGCSEIRIVKIETKRTLMAY